MRLPNWFKITWWVLILVAASVILIIRFDNISSGHYAYADTFIFLLWIILILYPIFSEINFFGLKVKKELEDLKNSIQSQILSLSSSIQNRLDLKQIVNIAHPTTAIPSKTQDLTQNFDIDQFSLMDKKIQPYGNIKRFILEIVKKEDGLLWCTHMHKNILSI